MKEIKYLLKIDNQLPNIFKNQSILKNNVAMLNYLDWTLAQS